MVSGKTAASASACDTHPSSTISPRTLSHRSFALSGLIAGSHADGAGMMPAIIAASDRVMSFAGCPK